MARRLVPLAAVSGAVALVALLVHNPFVLDLIFAALIFAVLGQAWNWISGYAGQVSFGQAVFFGCGAYASALFALNHGSPWLAIAAGAALAAALAVAIGFPCFALRGHYFSIATIAVGAILETVAKTVPWLGSANGFQMPILGSGAATLQFSDKAPYVALALAVFAAVQALTLLLENSRMGYYLRAIRANQQAAASVGIDARAWKLAAFAAAAVMSALAGSLYAQYTLFVDPESTLALAISISIALVGVVGGVGTVWGPPLGALVYVFLARFVAAKLGGAGNGLDLVLYGGLIVIIAALRPSGIVGLLRGPRRARSGP